MKKRVSKGGGLDSPEPGSAFHDPGSVPNGSRASVLDAHRPESAKEDGSIIVRGARVHNLKGVDCEIPHNRLTVVTGLSGSGKSSLAFDTLYAEGQRRYVESLSAYARQFLERMEKPDVDDIEGIAPAVAIRQKNLTRNPRSTVATSTEIYDYLRLLFARIGTTTCPRCGQVVQKDHVDGIADRILGLEGGRRFYILFRLNASPAPEPVPRLKAKLDRKPGSRGRPRKQRTVSDSTEPSGQESAAVSDSVKHHLSLLRQRGFNRLFQDGRVFEFSTPESLLDVDFRRPVYALVDRLSVHPDIRQRLIDSVEICYREAGEAIIHLLPRTPEEAPEWLSFNERFECKRCHTVFPEPQPSFFSFNNPAGACPRCQGFGNTIDFDLDLVIPDKKKTLGDGAIEPWTKPRYRTLQQEFKSAARARGIPLNVPFYQLAPEHREWIMQGEEDGEFGGVRGFFKYLERKKYKLHIRVFLSRYRGYAVCSECHGGRLRREALNVSIQGKNIVEVCRLSIQEARNFFSSLILREEQSKVAERVLEEIRSRMDFLYKVGLEYLTLDRLASTLSGGESQRIQLATALGSNLVGTLYVLDEPSIGLHSRDTDRLIGILKNLRDIGNTILVVEHDPEMIRHADKILDLGPGAGEHGGRIIYAGDYDGLVKDSHSLTGCYLRGEMSVPVPVERRKPGKAWLRIRGARQHNLKSIDVDIPVGLMVCISGVSGSGKSTLVHDVLYNAIMSRRGIAAPKSELDSIEGDEKFSEVILVDQSPLGRTPRSNPVTYIKAFDGIREAFASTPDARKHHLGPGHFSFNIPGGRCETCQGDGTVTVEMQFLADVELVCEECHGMRFRPAILDVRYKGKNIHEVLQMTVKEAIAFFAGVPSVAHKMHVLDEVGLGYLRLGQSATTLSGGEAQRVRLAAHMAHSATAQPLFIFDEPTTGLHFDDIAKLLAAFRRLIELGATVLIIEHNLDVLKVADWIIDLGPEGGEAGGTIVAAGPPEAVAACPQSYTGKFLTRYFSGSAAGA
ncbi:MAG TPA: excinuclease ABC subunit UvrA [Terriglobia bacterium]|nr:excinuclease ABC subunit UvrA [Terriglobia bacterium]